MSAKYYSISRKKYRTTVISLTLSVVIFLASAGFTGIVTAMAKDTANNYNYDFSIQASEEKYTQIRELDCLTDSTLVWDGDYQGILTTGAYTESYLDNRRRIFETGAYVPQGLNLKVYFLEDDRFRSFVQEQGIDPEPYFTTDTPTAICIRSKSTIYLDNEDGTFDRETLTATVFSELPASVDLHSPQLSSELMELIVSFGGGMDFSFSSHEEYLVQTFTIHDAKIPAQYPTNADGTISFILIPQTRADGSQVIDFHYFSLDTKTVGERLLTEESIPLLPAVTIRDQADEVPFGVGSFSTPSVLVLILPEAALFDESTVSLQVKTSDYAVMTAWLRANLEEYEYQDLLHSQMQSRNVVTMVNVFSYGFIILVSLICVCNVFNTISTNIALRRRDFGMLRSVGMQERQLRRMLGLECARYGVRSLLWGLPIGVGAGFGIYRLLDLGSGFPYRFPWMSVCIAAAAVFVVVFITMGYAFRKLRRDDPITAIRMDAF